MKRLMLVLGVVVLVSAVAFAQNVQSGNWAVDPSTSGYNLNKGNGDRIVTIDISFPKPFEVRPTVIIAVNSIDVDKGANTRFAVEAISVSRDGFTLRVKTWADTKINSIAGSWLAH